MDFNQAHETQSFNTGPLGLYNVVIKNQHSTNGGREILFVGHRTVSNCKLIMKNVVMYDVEFNSWVYSNRCHDVEKTVCANCDNKYTLQREAPRVKVETQTFKIIEGQGDYGEWGVYGGDYPFRPPVSTTSATSTTKTATTKTATTKTGTTVTMSTTTATTKTATTTTLPLVCGAGEYVYDSSWSGQACRTCPYGTYREGESHPERGCVDWGSCGATEHAVEKATSKNNIVCETTTECADGEYEYRTPSSSRDRQCKPITPCLEGQYIAVPATETRDQRCRMCDRSQASYDGGCTTTTRTYTTKTATTKTSTSNTQTTTPQTSTTTTLSSTTTTTTTTTTTRLPEDIIKQAQDDGMDLRELVQYVPLESLIEAGYTPDELSDEGIPAQDLARVAISLDSFSLADLKDVEDVDAEILRDFGWKAEELMKAGFASKDLVDAGYSSRQVTLAEERMSAAASAATGGGGGDESGIWTTVAVLVVVLLLAIGAAVWFVLKRRSSGDTYPESFENPMYDTANIGSARGASMHGLGGAAPQDSSYVDVNPLYSGDAGELGGGATGYMDVSPNAMAMTTSGYMDVPPAAAGGVITLEAAGYMDVSPNQNDVSDSDGEEV